VERLADFSPAFLAEHQLCQRHFVGPVIQAVTPQVPGEAQYDAMSSDKNRMIVGWKRGEDGCRRNCPRRFSDLLPLLLAPDRVTLLRWHETAGQGEEAGEKKRGQGHRTK